METALFPKDCDSVRVIHVIETKSVRGLGTTEQPTRIVTEYWSPDGEKLAESDPLWESAKEELEAACRHYNPGLKEKTRILTEADLPGPFVGDGKGRECCNLRSATELNIPNAEIQKELQTSNYKPGQNRELGRMRRDIHHG